MVVSVVSEVFEQEALQPLLQLTAFHISNPNIVQLSLQLLNDALKTDEKDSHRQLLRMVGAFEMVTKAFEENTTEVEVLNESITFLSLLLNKQSPYSKDFVTKGNFKKICRFYAKFVDKKEDNGLRFISLMVSLLQTEGGSSIEAGFSNFAKLVTKFAAYHDTIIPAAYKLIYAIADKGMFIIVT